MIYTPVHAVPMYSVQYPTLILLILLRCPPAPRDVASRQVYQAYMGGLPSSVVQRLWCGVVWCGEGGTNTAPARIKVSVPLKGGVEGRR